MTDVGTVERGSRAIPYEVEGRGPVPLVLIAEPDLDRALVVVGHYLVEEAGFHVVRIGCSSDEATIGERAADALAVIDHLGIDHTWIGGHGSGGTAARAFALAHPDRVNGLLLLGVEDVEIPLAPLIPVLIIQGADDDATPAANGERLFAAAAGRAHLRTLPGTDHLFPLTHPVETAIIIEEHLDWD